MTNNSYRIEQDYKYVGEDYWEWNAWIEASKEELDAIKAVKWILHETFPDPIRVINTRDNKFRLETGGWGIFKLKAVLISESGEEIKINKMLELWYPDERGSLTQ